LFNFKISGIAGGAAFGLSFLIGLISGSGFVVMMLRALGFGALFFVLFCVVFWILGQFIPDILSNDDPDISGSRVNITVDGRIEGAFPTGNSNEVDNIEGKRTASVKGGYASGEGSVSAGMDLEDQSGYTDKEDGLGNGGSGEIGVSGGGGVPDFDVLSGSFAASSGDVEEAEPVVFESEPRRPLSVGGGKSDIMGDFNPKDLARGIQTVLKKEEKG
jgi:hypothetical protein